MTEMEMRTGRSGPSMLANMLMLGTIVTQAANTPLGKLFAMPEPPPVPKVPKVKYFLTNKRYPNGEVKFILWRKKGGRTPMAVNACMGGKHWAEGIVNEWKKEYPIG